MIIISLLVHVYMLVILYEIFSEDRHCYWKWVTILFIGCFKYFIESVAMLKNLAPFIVCTFLIMYSICTHSKNSNLVNLKYALATYGIDYVINAVLGSICGLIAAMVKIKNDDFKCLVLSIARVIITIILCKCKTKVSKIRYMRAFHIYVIAITILLFLEQIIRTSYTTAHKNYTFIALACTYLSILFITLWLLDHYKMAKIQKMYADDNQQMSQKLHRSKEILPMIANYVSTMDGTPDEGMRKKLEEVCHDYGKELGGTQMCAEFIETTGIDLVDLLLRTKIIECGEQDIELNVFVSTQIAEDMKRMDISDGEITRLMGDLLRNAINAVSKLQNRMILLLIARDENDCVLIRIYDSGIPFPPYVLERFGERGNTTWGTGNGIADMMETLRRVHASIEINMDMDAGDVFTKGIFICFDGEDNVNITQRREYPGDAEGRVCF